MHSNNRIQRMLDVFTRPMTQEELVQASGISQASVSRHINRMDAKTPRLVYVSAWRESRNKLAQPVAVWAYCPEGTVNKDAMRPAPKGNPTSVVEYRQRKRNRKKAAARSWAMVNQTNRRRVMNNLMPTRDPITAALFGVPL